jgi:hypothetical protein
MYILIDDLMLGIQVLVEVKDHIISDDNFLKLSYVRTLG